MKQCKALINHSKGLDIKINLRFYVLLIMFLTPFIDILNGVLGDAASIGKYIRSLIVVGNIIAITYLSTKKKLKRNGYFYLFLVYVVVQFCLRYFIHRAGFMEELSAYLKIVLFVSEIVLLFDCLNLRLISQKDFDLFWKYSLLVIPISMFVAYLTSSGRNYGISGNQGYFVSVNALMVVMIMQVNISVLFALQRKLSWAVVFLNLLAIFFIGTKTSYVFVGASMIFMLFYMFCHNTKLFNKLISIAIVGAVLLVIVMLVFFRKQMQSIRAYQLYFLEDAIKNGKIFNYLLSGRDSLLAAGFQVMNGSELGYLFGTGFYHLESGIAKALNLSGLRGIEMDPFEIWFSFGLPMLIYVYSFFYITFRRKSKLKLESFIINTVIFLTFIYSALGGHTIMESLGGMYCAILLAYKMSLSPTTRKLGTAS